MSKRLVSAANPELPLLEPSWTPARAELAAKGRNWAFLLVVIFSVVWAWQPLTTVIGRSLKSTEYEHYSHIILLPFLTAFLLYLNRRALLDHVRLGIREGILPVAIGAATIWLTGSPAIAVETEDRLSLAMLGFVTLWIGGFIVCYGVRALRAAAFPFVLLFFMVPLPPAVLTGIIRFLQRGSAEASDVLFGLIGMPTFRQGFFFALPGLTIQVAEECSGIRSSLALLLSGLLIAYLFLRSTWTKAAFVLMIVPLAIVKNAVRIVVLSWLAIHVDPSFVTGSAVHRNGGVPVFLASLVLLGGAAWLLRRCEAWKAR